MQGNNRTILVQHLEFLIFNLFCICCPVIQHKSHSLNNNKKKKQDRQMGEWTKQSGQNHIIWDVMVGESQFNIDHINFMKRQV